MKKFLFAGVILFVLIGLAACSLPVQEKEKSDITSIEKTISETTATKIQEQKPAESYCGDRTCDDDETCAICSEDCGKCSISIFSGECERKGIYHTVKLHLKNPNNNQLNIKAYPRAIFTDVGVFDGDTRDLAIEGRSIKAYSWSFDIGENKISDKAKIVMVGTGNKVITNEITIECVED